MLSGFNLLGIWIFIIFRSKGQIQMRFCTEFIGNTYHPLFIICNIHTWKSKHGKWKIRVFFLNWWHLSLAESRLHWIARSWQRLEKIKQETLRKRQQQNLSFRSWRTKIGIPLNWSQESWNGIVMWWILRICLAITGEQLLEETFKLMPLPMPH